MITAQTKSGGNVVSGTALYTYQNKGMVQLDSFQRVNGTPKPDYRRALAAFSIGGPIIKDKLHFFGSYEGNYQNRANAVNIRRSSGRRYFSGARYGQSQSVHRLFPVAFP